VLDRLNRHDLPDREWGRLRVFLPADPPRGGRWPDHRMVINGIFFRARAGCPWRDLPEGFGNWKTVYNRHRRWSLDGTWEKILDGLRAGCDEAEGRPRRRVSPPRTCLRRIRSASLTGSGGQVSAWAGVSWPRARCGRAVL
jgi:transposase